MIKIHNFARGARGLRLMWQCEEMGVPYELVTVPYPPSDAYRALNPMGTVPFLEDTETGVAINESIAMMLYLANKYGPTPLLPSVDDHTRLARVLQLTIFSEATLGSGVNTLLAAHFSAPDDQKRNWSVTELEERVERAISFVTSTLGKNIFLTGDDITLADIAISTSLGVYRGALGKTLPNMLVSYRERLSTRPAYDRATKAQRANAEKANAKANT
jgi:glutathione S-transferase